MECNPGTGEDSVMRSPWPKWCVLLPGLIVCWAVSAEPSRYGYQVVRTYPHDPDAFTQGLFYFGGWFYEGTGLRGKSSLRQVDPETGRAALRVDLAPRLFGEGIAGLGDRIYQLTWRAGIGLVFDRERFELLGQFSYSGEGWGLTTDGTELIMSDGTDRLRFLDPQTLEPVREVSVTLSGEPVRLLNELEYIQGEVWANVWQTDTIVRIDPLSGQVRSLIDLTGILDPVLRRTRGANGIAYDAELGRVFVTGKWWPSIFEIRLVAKPDG